MGASAVGRDGHVAGLHAIRFVVHSKPEFWRGLPILEHLGPAKSSKRQAPAARHGLDLRYTHTAQRARAIAPGLRGFQAAGT